MQISLCLQALVFDKQSYSNFLASTAGLLRLPLPNCRCLYPEPWADPKNSSTSGFYNLHHRNTEVQNLGFYLLDPPWGSGYRSTIKTAVPYSNSEVWGAYNWL